MKGNGSSSAPTWTLGWPALHGTMRHSLVSFTKLSLSDCVDAPPPKFTFYTIYQRPRNHVNVTSAVCEFVKPSHTEKTSTLKLGTGDCTMFSSLFCSLFSDIISTLHLIFANEKMTTDKRILHTHRCGFNAAIGLCDNGITPIQSSDVKQRLESQPWMT